MPELPDLTEHAFSFAADVAKQLITVAAGLLAVSVTYVSAKVQGGTMTISILTKVAWGAMVVSILMGLMTLGSLTAQLSGKEHPTRKSINKPSVTRVAGLQFISFFVGVAAFAGSGFRAGRKSS